MEINKNSAWLPVVAIALVGASGRVLLQRRPVHKYHGGMWEFPGGKVEPGETPRAALVREIAEELGVVLEPGRLQPLLLAEESRAELRTASGGTTILMLYLAREWGGEIEGREGQQWAWMAPGDTLSIDLAPMDRTLMDRLPTLLRSIRQ